VHMLCFQLCALLIIWAHQPAASAANAGAPANGQAPGFTDGINPDLFWRQGFLWIRGFASQAEVANIRASMAAMLDSWEPPTEGAHASLSLRSSGNNTKDDADHKFLLESATKASFFLEAGAVDAVSGALKAGVPKHRAVRKVAHGIHRIQGPIREFVTSPKIARLASALGWHRPAVVQTLYRLAPPFAAGVDRHQDSTFIYTEPPSCLGLWLSLENASKSTGCLRVRVGSHREPIYERLVRTSDQLAFVKLSNASRAPDTAFSPLETASGDLLVMHGALEHFSASGTEPNQSRESLQVHFMDTNARWSPENWLQYPPGISFTELKPFVHDDL